MDMVKSIEAAEDSAWKHFREHMNALARMKQSAQERQRSSMVELQGEALEDKSLPVNNTLAFASPPAKEDNVSMELEEEVKCSFSTASVPDVSKENVSLQDANLANSTITKPYKKQKVLMPSSYTVRRVRWGSPQVRYMQAKPKHILGKISMDKKPCEHCEGFIKAIGLSQDDINKISKH